MVSWDRSVLCHYSLPDTASDRFVSISLILSIELGWLGVNFEASKLHTVAWLWVCWTLRHDSDSVGEWQVLCHCLWVSDRCFLGVVEWTSRCDRSRTAIATTRPSWSVVSSVGVHVTQGSSPWMSAALTTLRLQHPGCSQGLSVMLVCSVALL